MNSFAVVKHIWRIALYLAAVCLTFLAIGFPPVTSSEEMRGAVEASSFFLLRDENSMAQGALLVVEGAPAEIGFQLGSQLRDEIRATVTSALKRCAAGERNSWWTCRAKAEALRESLSPAMLEELSGIARGAGVSDFDISLLNSMSDALFLSNQGGRSSAIFAAWGEATVAEKIYMGGVLHHDDGLSPVWVARRPSAGRQTVLLALPGWLGGVAGVNDDGLSALSLPLETADIAIDGLPTSVVLRMALEESAAPEDAAVSVLGQAHVGGAQMLFGGGQNGVQGLEFTARQQSILKPELDTLASVGLYARPEFIETQLTAIDSDEMIDLQERWHGLESRLRTNVGWIGVEKSLAVLRSLAGEGGGVLLLLDPTNESIWFGQTGEGTLSMLTFRPFDLP